MMLDLLPLLLPVAAASGWYIGRKKNHSANSTSPLLPQDYFVGLNYLINEQADKAVDVFIKMLTVNSDTVETHLALGSLFRRRGEVDRAIRIHQNLIARPQLPKEQRTEAIFELAQDYLRAGVLDRAERLFLELADMGEKTSLSLHYLLNIYQQQKDWEHAITTAQKLEMTTHQSMHREIAHYYCELANQVYEKKSLPHSLITAQHYLRQALAMDKECIRASIFQGELERDSADYVNAIRCYKQAIYQDPDYLSEIIFPLAECYEQIGKEEEYINYLQNCLAEYPRISVVLMLSNYLRKWQGDRAAIEFIAHQIHKNPSLRGVEHLIQLYIDNSHGDAREKLSLLRHLIKTLLTNKPIYRCSRCGFSAKSLYWQCLSCKSWNTVKPIHGLEGD